MKTEHTVKNINRIASNLLKVAIICVLLVGITGCSADTSTNDTPTKDTPTKRHPFSWVQMQKDKMLVGFTEEQENRILEAFNVVIPENEEEAYVYSFYFSGDKDYLRYILEIDGVKDYDAFFLANSGRVKENGISGKSENEIGKNYHPMTEYYISYYEVFYPDPKLQSDEEKEMLSVLSALYDEIKEEKNNHS